MLQPIQKYSVLEFESLEEELAFTWRLLTFVGSREGLEYMTTDPRAVVWSEDIGLGVEHDRLYLSDGALSAARAAGLQFQVAREIDKAELPEIRSLLIGDQRDWEI